MYIKKHVVRDSTSVTVDPIRESLSDRTGSAEVRTRWLRRTLNEVFYRFHIVMFAHTQVRAEELERERAYAERNRLAEEYAEGYLAGWHECYAACLNAVEEEIATTDEIWATGALLASPEGSLKTN